MKKKSVAGSISLVMIIMIFSRLLALLSAQVYLSFFGAGGQEINIYSYAISVPNIVFNCFGTAIATVVIPIYAGHIARNEQVKAKHFADNLITITLALTSILVLLGIGLSFVLPKFTAFADNAEDYSFAVKALMIMMPVMIFYALNYIFQGMLQSIGKYNWPAFVSVPSSLAVILYVLLLGDKFGVTGLLFATFFGLALQAVILIPPLFSAGYRYKPSFNLKDEDIKNAGKMTLPVILGVSAYQFNMFYNVTMIANFKGMVTLLTYVQNITLYMVLAFVYSITAVIYPKLTEQAAVNDMNGYKKTLTDITKTIIALLLPVTFGFIAVRCRLLELIAKWGQITDSDIKAASYLLIMYSVGITAVGIKEVYDRAFYAVKNTWIPAANGFVIMAVNIILSLILTRVIGAYGIPLAYSAASIVGALVLIFALRKKIGQYGKGIPLFFIKCLLSALIMFAVVYFEDLKLNTIFAADTLSFRIIKLFIPCITGVIVYGICGLIFKIDYITNIFNKILRRG